MTQINTVAKFGEGLAACQESFPSIIIDGGYVRQATYGLLNNRPNAILNHIQSRALSSPPLPVDGQANSGSTTSASLSLTDPIAAGGAGVAVYEATELFGVQILLTIPRDQALPTPTIAITGKSHRGRAVDNTIKVSFDPSSNNPGNDRQLNLLVFFGTLSTKNGLYYYAPALVKTAETSPVITASTVDIAASNLTSNNQLDVRGLVYGHEDIDQIFELLQGMACGGGQSCDAGC